MKWRELFHRLTILESKSIATDAWLHFADGSTRAIRIQDPLKLLLDAFRREHARASGEDDPEIQYAQQLDLLGGAESVEGENLIQLAWQAARDYAAKTPEEIKQDRENYRKFERGEL